MAAHPGSAFETLAHEAGHALGIRGKDAVLRRPAICGPALDAEFAWHLFLMTGSHEFHEILGGPFGASLEQLP